MCFSRFICFLAEELKGKAQETTQYRSDFDVNKTDARRVIAIIKHEALTVTSLKSYAQLVLINLVMFFEEEET